MPHLLRLAVCFGFVFATGALIGCPTPTPVPDGGGDDAGTSGPNDGGDVETDGGGASDAGVDGGAPLTLDERAARLCRLHLNGEANLARHIEAPFQRCAATDVVKDSLSDPTLVVDTSVACLPGEEIFALYRAALQGGRVAFDDDKIDACVAKGRAVRTQSTTMAQFPQRESALEALAVDVDCEGAVTPLLAPGDICVHAWDCPAGTGCEAAALDGQVRQCLAPADVGASCADGAIGKTPIRTCVATAECFDGVCAQRKPANQVCGPGQVACAAGLVCGPSSLCTPPVDEGNLCTANSHCVGDLYCADTGLCTSLSDDGASCEGNHACENPCSVCRPLGVDAGVACLDRGAGGASCLVDDHCREGFVCGVDDTCRPFGGIGQACSAVAPCAAVLTCAPVDADGGIVDGGPVALCATPAPLLAPCAAGNNPCATGYCVNAVCESGQVDSPCDNDGDCRDENLCVSSLCVRAPREDAPCTVDGRCESGLTCVDDRCRGLPAAGNACIGGQCASQAFCRDGMCIAKKNAGGECLVNAECVAGTCLPTGTCGADTPSCLSTDENFGLFMIFAMVVPVGLSRRRRPFKN